MIFLSHFIISILSLLYSLFEILCLKFSIIVSCASDGDEFCKFSRERYHGKIMRSPRLNFMPDRRRFSDQTESNMHDRDTKSKFFQ